MKRFEGGKDPYTFAATRKSKSRQCPDDAKDILSVYGRNSALGWFRSMNGELGARRRHNLLLFRARKLT